MDAETSSTSPNALFTYANTGLRINAQLEASASRLAVALDEFTATCREYSLGINSGIAQGLREYARRTSEHDLWVRHVGEQFLLADQGLVACDGLVMATLDSRTSVADWSAATRIETALERAVSKLPRAMAEQLRALLTPENVAALVLVLGVWAASHALGIGEIMDLILAVVGVVMLGPEAIRAVKELVSFATGAVGAQTDADLDQAGEHLAAAIAIVGVDGAMALLAHRASGDLGGKLPKIERGNPELVTPEGVRLNLGSSTDFTTTDPLAMSGGGTGGAQGVLGGLDSVDTEVVSLEAVQESQAALQRALEVKGQLPPDLRGKTVASDGEKTLSGVAPPRPEAFTTVRRETVFDHADKIGYEISGHARDIGARGQQGWYNASHADKQLAILRPSDPIGISQKICDDCMQFLRYDARYNQSARVTSDPYYGTLVFQPDGSIVRPDGTAFTINRGGRVIEFPALDLGPGPLDVGPDADVTP